MPVRVATSRQTVIEIVVPKSAAGAIIGSRGSQIKQVSIAYIVAFIPFYQIACVEWQIILLLFYFMLLKWLMVSSISSRCI